VESTNGLASHEKSAKYETPEKKTANSNSITAGLYQQGGP
jgi:hypothetical protein